MNNLEDIKNRLAKATPGPWEVGGMDSGHSKFETNWWVTAGEGDTVCDMDGLSRSNNEAVALDDGFADAEFIAHAPEDVARLVKALEDVLEHIGWAEMNKSHWVSANSLRAKITEALDS